MRRLDQSDILNNSSIVLQDEDSFQRSVQRPNKVAKIRNTIQPTYFRQDDVASSRKILAQNIENGDGDLNTIWDVC